MLLVKNDYRVRADRLDWRDLPYVPSGVPLRPKVDLRPWATPVERQGHLGSCTGNAAVGVYELLINFEKEHQLDLSRLFVYYNARLIEDAVQQDVGAYVRDVVKALKQYGVCAESVWPYNIDKFAAEPTPESYTDARSRTIKNYYRISGLPGALDALNNNWPVLFGMEVYPEFDDITTADPVLQMPNKDAEPIGGHAMCLVGYDLDKKLVIARNSFGPNWADHGYCYIPFDYVTNEFVDMWVFDIDLIKAN